MKNLKVFESGATRSKINPVRYDLITPIGLRRLAETYAEGVEIHGERNWENGLPISDCINRAIRHIYLYLSKDKEEDHLAHASWNLFAAMHFEEDWIGSRKQTNNFEIIGKKTE